MPKSLKSAKAPGRSTSRPQTRTRSSQTSVEPTIIRRKSPSSNGTPGTRILVIAETSAQRGRLARGVASELKRDLHRVDLGRITSKYIGETEKNLRALFNSAEAKQGVLYFDEADALFGRRSGVKDSHDRYANLETSYLLDRIERSAGVVVLATDSARKIDPSWMKRLRFALKITPSTSGTR